MSTRPLTNGATVLHALRVRARSIPRWSSRRAIRAAIAAPIAFGLASLVLPPAVALFAAFGTVIQILFVEFVGPGRHARTMLFTAATAALIAIGSLLSTNILLAAVGIAILGFAISFAGYASPAITTGTPAALFVLTLAGTVPTDLQGLLPRLTAWALASACVWVATTVILPAPDTDPLWGVTMTALDGVRQGMRDRLPSDRSSALRTALLTAPHQPGALSRRQRQLIALTDRVLDLTEALDRVTRSGAAPLAPDEADLVSRAVVDAQLALAGDETAGQDLHNTRVELENAREHREDLYEGRPTPDDWQAHLALQAASALAEAATGLDDSPRDVAGTAWRLLRGQLTPRSTWFRSSARTAIALGISIAVAHVLGLEHAFWVSFGTLTVLRTNALNTGQSAGRALLGTAVGAVVGEALILVSPAPVSAWVLLPIAILVTGLAPGFFSFTVGQGAFTVAILLLFGVSAPGSSLGLARVEDLLIGAAVSVLVALFAWPRGAAASFRENLAAAYEAAADYLEAAVGFAVGPQTTAVCATRRRALVAAEQRAEQALRGLLLERGSSFASPGEVAAVLTVATASRDVADWMIDFSTHRRLERGTRVARWAATALEAQASEVAGWQRSLAAAVRSGGDAPGDPGAALPATEPGPVDEARRVDVAGNDALAAWVAAQLDALALSIGEAVPAVAALPPR